MPLPCDVIIFDCDGTLVDSERLGHEVLVEHVAQHGLKLTVEDAMTRFRGIKMAESIAQLEALLGRSLPDSFVPELRARMAQAFMARLQPVDGALELVRSLTLPFCVASSGPREKIELSLSVTGLLPYFTGRIFSSYEVGAWKPSPGLFIHTARTMNASPERCLVVEDSLPGVEAGLAAGMRVVAFQPNARDARIPAEVRVISSLRELPALLDREDERSF
jgi:HAD superfamily hydrolase (TIGR01509 family)